MYNNLNVVEVIDLTSLTVRVGGWATTGGRRTNPVIVDGLVGVQNRREALSGVDIDILDFSGLMFNTVSFNESDVVVVDGESPEGTARHREDTQAVPLPLLDVYDSPGN